MAAERLVVHEARLVARLDRERAAPTSCAAPLVGAPAELLAVGTWRDAGPLAERVAE